MRKKAICITLFVGYQIILIYFLFFAELFGRTTITQAFRYNLEPFKEISRFIRCADQLGMSAVFLNLAGNVLIFVPFGFFIGIFQQEKVRISLGVLWSFNVTLAVELLQLISRVGCFDVDDLILNTLGGTLGIILYKILVCLSRKKRGRNGDSYENDKEI